MKTSTVGLVLAAILMVVAAVGFGIAQAEETHTIGEFMEWQTFEAAGGSHSEAPVLSFVGMEVLPSAIDVDYGADGNPSTDVAQAREAVETGGLPAESNSDASIVEIDGISFYLFEGKLYGPEG